MKKSLLELYALTVCLFTVICFTVALGVGLYAVVSIASPQLTLNAFTYTQHQTNDAFWDSCNERFCSPEDRSKNRPAEAELTVKREQSLARALENERREALQTALKAFIFSLIAGLIFFFHWRIAHAVRSTA